MIIRWFESKSLTEIQIILEIYTESQKIGDRKLLNLSLTQKEAL